MDNWTNFNQLRVKYFCNVWFKTTTSGLKQPKSVFLGTFASKKCFTRFFQTKVTVKGLLWWLVAVGGVGNPWESPFFTQLSFTGSRSATTPL